MNRQFFRNNAPLIFGMCLTAVGITVFGVVFRQSPFRILPLYVSLVIALLQSRVIRYASLLGGINSILYALVFAHYRLFASAVYALLVSCPFQIITFIRWNKKPWKHSTVFRKMSKSGRLAALLLGCVSLAVMYIVLTHTGGEHALLDGAVTLLGIAASLLAMLSYMEYAAVMTAGGVCSVLLYLSMLAEHPEQTTYLIYTLYSLTCSVVAVFRLRKLYAEQHRDPEAADAGSRV